MSLPCHALSPRLRSLWLPMLLPCMLLAQGALQESVNPWQFTHFTRKEGLVSSSVISMTQDRAGFLWFGTDQGLQRFDGKRFHTYRHDPEDPRSLPSEFIPALHTDEKGRIWVATDAGIGRFDPQKGGFTPVPGPQGPIKSGFPARFLKDSRGVFWFIGSEIEGRYRYLPKSDRWEREPFRQELRMVGDRVFEDPSNGDLWFLYFHGLGHWRRRTARTTLSPDRSLGLPRSPEGQPASLFIDSDNTMWVQTLVPSSREVRTFSRRLPDGDLRESPFPFEGLCRFHEDRQRRLWYFTADAPWFGYIDLASGVKHRFRYLPEASVAGPEENPGPLDIFEDREANIWVLTGRGVWVFNPSRQAIQSRQAVLRPDGSVEPLKVVSTLFESSRGEVWVGTYFGGIHVFDKDLRPLRAFRYAQSPAGTPDSINEANYGAAWSFAEDDQGRIWAGGQMGTMQLFSPEGRSIRRWQLPPPNNRTIRRMVYVPGSGLWLGLQHGAVLHLDPASGKMRRFTLPNMDKTFGHVDELLPDGPDRMWILIKGNLCGMDIREGRFAVLPSMLKGNPGLIKGIRHWNDSTLLVLTTNLWFFDKRTLTFYRTDQLRRQKLRHVHHAQLDGHGKLWFMSIEGVGQWDPSADKVRWYGNSDGLPDIETSEFRAMCRLRDGRMLASAGRRGFMAFHPDSLSRPIPPPELVLTGLRTPQGELPLPQPGQTIDFPHDVNLISVAFASPTWLQQAGLRYRYRLDGPRGEWLDNGSRGSIELNGLSPGSYNLEIQAVNREGLHSGTTATLNLRILPPWWFSPLALAAYALLLGYLGLRIYRFALKRRLEQAEVQRIRELETFKAKFYTNITHEFRTPLTVIDGMASLIRENPQVWMEEGLSAIRSSSDRMMKLVNQILDLSKLDSGSLKLRKERIDLVLFLRYLCDSLRPLARAEGVDLHCHADRESLDVDTDEERLRQIVENLISNALKFTPEGGSVTVSLHVEPSGSDKHIVQHVCIQVADNGIGIAPEHLPHLFEAYFRADDEASLKVAGTGIGLPFARELARLMGGDIEVASEKGKGSAFTLRLPLQELAAAERAADPSRVPGSVESEAEDDRAEVLIIEDDPDVARYLEAVLSGEFSVRIAGDGEAGIRECRERIPDLVVSDVMMPRMDGLQVTATLRNDILTSHIPIVLLTAKVELEDRLQGLDHGADAYLSKPFERRELLALVQRLLRNRALLREHYLSAQGLEQEPLPETPAAPALSARESAFLEQVRETVERHLADPDFSVERLAAGVFMSQSQLHRKLKSLAGLSPVQYIRRVRLQHARELLSGQPDLPVYAVAECCGFDDSAYFIRVFRQEFGVTPATWRNGAH